MPDRSSWSGKRAVVVGAGSGIGRAVARDLAGLGVHVAAIGRDRERLAEMADGTDLLVVPADLREDVSAQVAFAQVAESLGGLDLAVNTLGVFPAPAPTADTSSTVLGDVLATNVVGLHRALRHEIVLIRDAGGGAVVNLASNIGSVGTRPGFAAYAASKAAVVALTRTAALDHIADGVRINAVSPGATDTAMSFRPGESRSERDARVAAQNPSGRVAAVEEVVGAVRYLLSPEATYVVGHELVVDGGLTAG